MEYEALEKKTDEELLELIRTGDSYAMDTLIVRYKNLVRKNVRRLYLIGGDHDDLLQEGMIGLYKAIRDYDREKNSNFLPFANLCISRQIYTAIQASNTRKNQPLNNYISFDAAKTSEGENEAETLLSEGWLRSASGNPEELLIDQESDQLLEEYLASSLSDFEMQVLRTYLEEENYARVAERLGKSPKTVDNALQRVRRKLMKLGLFIILQ